MSEQHPAIKPYMGEHLPAESAIISAWELAQSSQGETAPVTLTTDDAARLLCLAGVAEHWGFVFEHLLPATLKVDPRSPQIWNLLLASFPLKENEGLQPFRDFLDRLEREFRLSEHWLVPNQEGLCAWDEFLKDARGNGTSESVGGLSIQNRLAVLAEHVEKLPSEFLDADHPLHPGVSRKDIWLWGWCSFPMASQRLCHLKHLLARGANPNLSMEVEGGRLSVGSAILWARFPSRSIPVPVAQEKAWQTLDHLWEQASHNTPKWWDKKRAPFVGPVNDSPTPAPVLWAALAVLKHTGMAPDKLEEPSWWGAPLLGLLSNAKTDITDGHWPRSLIKEEWLRLMGMELAFFHPHHPERSVLSVALKEGPPLRAPARMFWLENHCIPNPIWKQCLNETALSTLCHGQHGACLLLEEPRLLAQLLIRFVELASANGSATFLPPAPVEQPLSSLGSCIEEVIRTASWPWVARFVTEFARFMSSTRALEIEHAPSMPPTEEAVVLGWELESWRLGGQAIPSSELLSKVYDWALLPLTVVHRKEEPQPKDEFSHYSALEAKALRHEKQQGKETLDGKSVPDNRPLTLLYSEKSSRLFLAWAESRKNEEIVKSWMGKVHSKITKTGGIVSESLPATARRLAKASPALAAMAKLRQAFPHFADVVDLIDRHLLLESRGRGVFSLPPLLMSGPPGTGKTFFFQELASYVDTSYTMLSMESITSGFSIVGLDYGWSGASPGLVFESLMKPGNTANPILLLDEIDKAPHVDKAPVSPVLLPLLEPHSSRRFRDRCIPLDLDASNICWVATANDLEKVSLPLKSRFHVLHVPAPDFQARRAMAAHIYAALRKSNSWGDSFEEFMPNETLQVLVKPAGSARDIRKNLGEAFSKAAQQNRQRIEPQDIPVQKSNAIQDPWDTPLEETEPSEGVVA